MQRWLSRQHRGRKEAKGARTALRSECRTQALVVLGKKEAEAGFQALSLSEKTYFAMTCLIGEVYNGGFEQFFSNSSGAMYGYALSGLLEIEAHEAAALLEEAKDVLFPSHRVPLDRQERNK